MVKFQNRNALKVFVKWPRVTLQHYVLQPEQSIIDGALWGEINWLNFWVNIYCTFHLQVARRICRDFTLVKLFKEWNSFTAKKGLKLLNNKYSVMLDNFFGTNVAFDQLYFFPVHTTLGWIHCPTVPKWSV